MIELAFYARASAGILAVVSAAAVLEGVLR